MSANVAYTVQFKNMAGLARSTISLKFTNNA
jgi:hypothetical protein